MINERMVESLKMMGLTEYEAKTFIALNRIRSGTVSDINVTSGIPRAAIYAALAKLEVKGLVEVEHGKPIRYRSIAPAKAINKLRDRLNAESEHVLGYLEEAHMEAECPEPAESMWTIRGVMNLYTKFSDMIAAAKKDIIIITTDPLFVDVAQQYPVFNNIVPLVQKKLKEGVRVRLVCTTKAVAEYASDALPAVEVRLLDPTRPSTGVQFKSAVLMTDDSEVLLGIIGNMARINQKDITATHTRQESIIAVFRHFMEVEWDSALPLDA
jgi:HTH-type transcriptional regulator, sugar sensing transcriptional regulator